jgi:hypothetical protein
VSIPLVPVSIPLVSVDRDQVWPALLVRAITDAVEVPIE